MSGVPWLEPLGRHNVSYQGEVNETTHKGFLGGADGPVVLRGANICRYAVRDSWRGHDRRLDKTRFLRDGPAGERATHYRHPRIGFQRSAPQNNFRRLIAAPIERDNFCFDTVSYFLADESALGPELLLALLNSEFLDWYFDLGSTNSKINEYRLNQLPVPRFDPYGPETDSRQQKLLASARWADLSAECCQRLGTANSRGQTLPASAAHLIRELVREVCRIERVRSLATHRERSQLAEPAGDVQAALDRIIFACYGIEVSDEEVIRESLKRRRRKENR